MERCRTVYAGILIVQSRVMRGVYAWMGGGLALTFVVSLMTVSSPWLLRGILGNREVLLALILAEVGMVFAVSGAIDRVGHYTACLLFLVYAALHGLTTTVVLAGYTSLSIASTFLVAAGMFTTMSLFGYATGSELTSWGSFLSMGLVGLTIASMINIALDSSPIYWVVNLCGILVFTGLAACDTQDIKDRCGTGSSGAILGALRLYLDLVNMFLLLLRLPGNRR